MLHAVLLTCSFFEDYKKNEHKEVIVDEFLGAEDAKRVIRDSLVSGDYQLLTCQCCTVNAAAKLGGASKALAALAAVDLSARRSCGFCVLVSQMAHASGQPSLMVHQLVSFSIALGCDRVEQPKLSVKPNRQMVGGATHVLYTSLPWGWGCEAPCPRIQQLSQACAGLLHCVAVQLYKNYMHVCPLTNQVYVLLLLLQNMYQEHYVPKKLRQTFTAP
jgi:hypothetical protein